MKRALIATVLLIASFTLFSQERCDYCRGSGYIIEKEYKTCSNCGGQGERTYTETKTCSLCKGSRKIYDSDGKLVKYCTSCDNGKVAIKRIEACGKCSGKGGYYVDEKKRCPRCGGSGKPNR